MLCLPDGLLLLATGVDGCRNMGVVVLRRLGVPAGFHDIRWLRALVIFEELLWIFVLFHAVSSRWWEGLVVGRESATRRRSLKASSDSWWRPFFKTRAAWTKSRWNPWLQIYDGMQRRAREATGAETSTALVSWLTTRVKKCMAVLRSEPRILFR
ncbi:hypothetical protein OUZ56_017765 [Daphnia magna]|uniref:Uncharacterized protein n=1 Tax=Daphnia magna TaxID=35525 RepID=A0ABR0ATS1_9CRUS|nr:hypothetical protein OUZ56_017765 [Daphnia magna]